MYPFAHSVTPAVRTHLDAQAAFLNDMSKTLSRSFQDACELNIQLGQTLLEESNIAAHQLLTATSPSDAISAAAARAQPAAEKLHSYQQHVARLAADGQLELARVTSQHAEVQSRTARELADQVARVTIEEAAKSKLKQQEIMKGFGVPFPQHGADRSNGGTANHGSMQSAGEGAGIPVEPGSKPGASHK